MCFRPYDLLVSRDTAHTASTLRSGASILEYRQTAATLTDRKTTQDSETGRRLSWKSPCCAGMRV